MSRRMIVLAGALAGALAAGGAAHAQPAPDAPAAPVPALSAAPTTPEIPRIPAERALGDQAIAAEVGLASGARVTPGGLRITGHYLYQLSDVDWFDGAAAFTFGSGRAACFRDRQDAVVCSHGLSDGAGVEFSARIRRMFSPHGVFHPFGQVGVGLGLARFADDEVTGFTVPLHAGGGVRVEVSPMVAIVVEDELALGFGVFGRGLGLQPEIGFAITVGAEFRLR